VIKLSVADPQIADAQIARWEQAAKLGHPHLLRVFHTGRCELGGVRMLYAVMEGADEDLSQVVPVRPLTAAEAGEMLRPTLEALTYLHGRGLVHGHVKPSNIMAVGEQVKISSDGIGAARNPAAGRGRPTVYEAPEAGTRGGSTAGDVWSLGVTLVEVLTQKLPEWEFKGQPEARLPRMPAPFGDIAKQCLRKDPQQRCTLADIAARLDPDAAPLGQQAVAAKAAPPPALTPASEPGPPPRAKAAAPPPSVPVAPRVTGASRPAAASTTPPLLRPQKPARGFAWRAAAIIAVIVMGALVVLKISSRGSAVNVEPDAKVVASDAQPAATESNPAAENPAPAKSNGGDTAAPTPAPAAGSSASATPARPARPRIQTAGAAGAVAHQVVPDVPGSARATIRGTVRVGVRVAVDASGKVVRADLESAGPSKYFAALAEKAARGWEFVPPTADGEPVSSDWILRFDFQSDGTQTSATPAKQ
jgi:TonB family protein